MTNRYPPSRQPLPRETLGVGRRGSGVFAKAVGSFLPRLTAKAFEKYGFSAASLVTDWATIAGPELASHTAPERLNWPRAAKADDDADPGRAGATLVLRVDGARALDVQYNGRQIIERINRYFGYAAIARLRIVQAPIARTEVQPRLPRPRAEPLINEVAGIGDPGLRSALARLGAEIKAGR
jgi:hypothetical protein